MEKGKCAIMPKWTQSGLCWGWITLVVLILDRLSKNLAQEYLSAYMPLAISPGFNLTLSYNKGAAFSFLDQMPGQTWIFGGIAIIVSIAIIVWMSRLSWRQYGVSIALALIIGGALGNLWDRLVHGHVIDFIQLYVSHFYWPVFNVADSAVCVGAGILFVYSFKKG